MRVRPALRSISSAPALASTADECRKTRDEPERTRGGGSRGRRSSTTLNAIGVFTEEDLHWVDLLVGFAVALAGAALIFGWFSRRAARRPERAWRTGLVCGVIGLL